MVSKSSSIRFAALVSNSFSSVVKVYSLDVLYSGFGFLTFALLAHFLF
jgi:hypothetical protein